MQRSALLRAAAGGLLRTGIVDLHQHASLGLHATQCRANQLNMILYALYRVIRRYGYTRCQTLDSHRQKALRGP